MPLVMGRLGLGHNLASKSYLAYRLGGGNDGAWKHADSCLVEAGECCTVGSIYQACEVYRLFVQVIASAPDRLYSGKPTKWILGQCGLTNCS